MITYPLYRYINTRWASNPTFSADGLSLAFLSDISGKFQVWQVDLSTDEESFSWPQQLTFAADRVLYVDYSPIEGDNRLVYGHDLGGRENLQLAVLDTVSGEERQLTAGHESAMHLPGEWSAELDALLVAANRRDPAIFDLYRLPVNGEPAQIIFEHDQVGYLHNAIWSPDQKRVAFTRQAKSAEHDLLELTLADGSLRQLNPAGRPAEYGDIAYTKDGRFLYVLTDLDSDFMHIAKLELATGDWEKLIAPNADVEQFALSPDGRYIAFCTNRDGDSYLELVDMAAGVSRPAPEPATRPGVIGYYGDHITFSADSMRLAFSYASATRTWDVYIWHLDLDDDALLRKTDSSHGGIPVSTFVAPSLIHYPTFDERQIPAYFFQPEDAGKGERPAIVFVHGGPESQFRPDFKFLIQYFVHNGYAVLAPNVRGSSGYGNAYMHLDNVEKRMDSVADLAYAARWLASQPGIDAGRLVVYGGSYGGFMVLSSLTTYPDLWAAGVNIVGISNFVTFLENTSAYRRAHRESEYGSLAKNRDFLQSISPLNQVDQIQAPLMVIHGANDPRVPLSEAQQLVDAVRAHGVPVEFLVFDDEGHGIIKLANKLVMYPAVIDFVAGVLA
ncbi:MAG: S9 family peptidase [Candidatus Promineifilaceae bacterium]